MSTASSGRTTTPAPRSPPRCSPGRSTSARWATTRCSSTAPAPAPATTAPRWSSVTGYNPRGALNGVVVAPDSDVADARATSRAATSPPASARPATARSSRRSTRPGIDPNDDVKVENQDPAGRRRPRCKAGSVDAVAQFVAWPGLLAFQDDARLVYDGGRLDVPTHARRRRPQGVRRRARGCRRRVPPGAARRHRLPARAPGRGGRDRGRGDRACRPRSSTSTTAATASRPSTPPSSTEQVDALEHDVPFLEVDRRARPTRSTSTPSSTTTLLRGVYGDGVRRRRRASLANPAAITGTRPGVRRAGATTRRRPARSGSRARTTPARSPTRPACCAPSRPVEARAARVRAAYVPDATTGTRWFADRMVWLRDGARAPARSPPRTARTSTPSDHPGAERVTWARRWRPAR